ncbi:sugar ABC transporter permease [Aliiglaciecola lipolytica]|uniref:Capsular polysaccharide transport system permease protein n=1 Tax=Aliiglaciecola lipolytica E3 TaxID=1127673 RepID=K6Y9J5_9ALTE|nr:sugar ABC transporter permease [Aliiglaciecola lipolytica]GAC13308.1 capsular polysaccharide transport system permease protein [Aliiglaciecola lipolytica E3]
MTEQSIDDVEQRFLDLRKEYTSEQWRDFKMLLVKVEELVETDVPLAYRLMQRVKNLDPSSANRKRLRELKNILLVKHPELMSLSSVEQSRSSQALNKIEDTLLKGKHKLQNSDFKMLLKPLFVFVVIPFLLFAFYQIFWASERFESRTQLILKQPDGAATLDPALALLSGFGSTSFGDDNELLKAYILSSDMIDFLQHKIALKEHYSSNKYDFYSRLSSDATKEDLHKYFSKHVRIEIDAKSSVLSIFVQGFEPDFVNQLAAHIVQRAEWYINEIGHNLAKEQLLFVQKEHQLSEKRLQDAKRVLLAFQREHDLLDPEAEGMALQRITYSLEGEIAIKQAELNALLSAMSEQAPAVLQAKAQLNSLNQELIQQRSRLTKSGKVGEGSENSSVSVSEILSRFSDLKIDLELALSAYSSSQVSLEKSRIEAYRQLKYLVVVESPTLPEESSYPKVFYNLTLFLTIALMLFLIGRIIAATVKELR